ncbi:hypothetical protein B9Z55_021262 [Caenorhabditis nigoni]|nr:hypothetical protein B9Z55_021262 [Caenorhabditis nigoni]
MPFAYNWLSKQQKANIEEIVLETYDGKVVFQLQCKNRSILPEICYERNGPSTLITFEQYELLVPLHFLDIFLEDLKMVLMNQETFLEYFRISSKESGISDAKCFSGIDAILKIRISALAVKEVHFTKITVSQGISMIRYLNSVALSSLIISEVESVNFKDLSNGLRNLEEDYLFNLRIGVKIIDEEDVIGINELSLFYGIIDDLEICFEFLQYQDEFRASLSDRFDLHKKTKWNIKFNRTNVPLVKKPVKQKTPIFTNVCEKTARDVLENPLLMEIILKHLECFDIQKLRKVNRGIRECIDTVKPDARIEKYFVYFDCVNDWSQMNTDFSFESGTFIRYTKWADDNESHSNIRKNKKDWTEVCLNDFETNLRHQKSCIDELSIVYISRVWSVSYEDLSKKIGKILKRRRHPLKTRKFSIGSGSQMEIMEILPAIDKSSLKIIELLHPVVKYFCAKNEEMPLEVDRISRTDQWKNSEQLISKFMTITTPIQDMNILHFAELDILVLTLSSRDVNYLRTMPFAYEWLTKQQKTNIAAILVDIYDDKIIFKIDWKHGRSFLEISYERTGRFTFVTFEQKELMVSQHFLDVFLEDLKMVLMNQKIVLNCFKVYSKGNGISAANCFSGLEKILKARTSALAVKMVDFFQITVSQGMSMIRYLNPDVLSRLLFVPDEPVSFEKFLNGLRNLGKGYRFDLKITVKTIGKDDLMSVNEFSSFSEVIHYLRISSEFLRHEDECRAILSDKFDLQKGSDWFITFKNPILMKTRCREKARIIPNLCEKTVRSVFENHIPMELILKQLECFDIQRLRKVNRDIRECIDTLKPNPLIFTINNHQILCVCPVFPYHPP